MITVIPGWIALGLFLAWFISHSLVIWIAYKRNVAIDIKNWQGPDIAEFEKKMFFAQVDLILGIWWFKAMRAIFIYGSISFFFLWLHYASL
ncbi:hypothetical protein D3C87_1150060 [compost metagenome]